MTQDDSEVLWRAVTEVGFRFDQRDREAAVGVALDGLRFVTVAPAVFGKDDDLGSVAIAFEDMSGWLGRAQRERDLLALFDGFRGPCIAGLFRTRTLGVEQTMPLVVERGRFCDGKRETEVQRTGMTSVAAGHPDGFAGESNLITDGEIRWRRDLGAQHDITIKALCLDLEHEGALGLGVDQFASFPASRELPRDLRGHANDARKAPVGMKATIMLDPEPHREGFARNDGGLLGNQLELEARLSASRRE